jgi:S1-C subfamily serine protease
MQALSGDIAEGLKLDRPAGALVAAVRERSPADAAGLRRGDIVVEVDGRPIDDPESFGYRFALKGVSGEAPLTVLRGGRREKLVVRLQPAPEVPARDNVRVQVRSPLVGANIANISPAVSEELGLDIGEGVVIEDIEEGSAAARVGFQRKDVLLSVNGEAVSSTRQLERLLRAGAQFWQITISRGGNVVTSVLGG